MQLVFFIAAGLLAALNALLLLTIYTNVLKLWPTPGKGSWQNFVFWPLFRGGLGLTLLYAALSAPAALNEHWAWMLVGAPLMLVGLAVTIYAYFDLGIDNTYGSDGGLVTGGLYAYSRNPQYVASIAGFLGVAVFVHTPEMLLLCGLAILVYSLMPLAEEPWLSKVYGEAFARYRARTPRFIRITGRRVESMQ
ncbi:MAG: PEMT/PEM2 methyltransferase family protein [Hyphomicrobiales bacterium]|nr:PEMT/PEM2 methyltransferase family protein [Hyphomicrobiales bacterium]